MGEGGRVRIIFAGTIGRSGLGGQAWANMQYLAGLRALGHDVVYLEDCGESSWVYNWETGEWTTDVAYPAAYVRACLEPVGFADRWVYRAGDECEGMAPDRLARACSEADLFIMRAVPMWLWREEYRRPRRRVFIDVDPGFTQMKMAAGDEGLVAALARCERHFTIGRRIGAADCPVPDAGYRWLKTVPPVALSQWPWAADGAATHFTSVMNWRGFQDAQYQGAAYGQKEKEFPKFLDLPRKTGQALRLAVMGVEPEFLTAHGWEVVPSWVISRTPASYRSFIQDSRAEFAVPKHGYVATQGGWFSDRSVCYLASGRPVLIEDTGLGDWLPTGDGLLTFRDVPGALSGIDRINAAYEHHRRAARHLAEEYFAAERVLPAFLDAAIS
jgi:hypothetical protein